MRKPYITIGIASYNYAKFLPKAFEAIKKQKFTDYEVLYCDDGSTDDSIMVIEDLVKKNPHICIRLIKGENKGVIANKERIIQNAMGEYLMVCDADDWMDDDCLLTLAEIAQQTEADRIIGGFRLVDIEGDAIRVCNAEKISNKWIHTLWHGCLFKTEVFSKCGTVVPLNFMSDDYYLINMYNYHCLTAVFTEKIIYNNLVHSNNATNINKKNNSWKPKENFIQVLDFADSLNRQLYSEDDRSYLQYQVIKFYHQALLSVARSCGSTEIRQIHSELRNRMQQCFPFYNRNKLLSLVKKNGDRTYGRLGVALISICEKMHFLDIALSIYHHLNLSLLIKDRV